MTSALRHAASPPPTGWPGRLGATASRPLVLASSVFLLVLAMGMVTTALNYRALTRAGEQRAEDELAARTRELKASLRAALASSDALLDRLAVHARRAAPETAEALLDPMYELATARAGVTWISVSFSDGTFVGVLREDGGILRGLLSRVTDDGGSAVHYRFEDGGPEREGDAAASDYDPRARAFYRLAQARKQRAWSAPYAFLPHYRTGVSRVEPLFDEAQRDVPRAVLTVDFDGTGLAPLLDGPRIARGRELVLAADGSVLAASGVALPDVAGDLREQAIGVGMLEDPVVRAALGKLRTHRQATVSALGEPWRFEQVKVAELDGQAVQLVSLVPEGELFARAHKAAVRGVVGVAGLALVAVFLAWILASHIARLRARRDEAEREAERARAEATELGSYQLIEPLGAGGMGEVYRARHKLLARDAALKLIRSTAASEAEQAARAALFFAEARTLASLRSVHTVAVYDFGIADDGRYFLAMELLDGMDLDTLVRRHGPQPPARVAAILAQVCESLAEAHQAGLVHRDVKPANLFLSRLAGWLDVVKVLDFGLTRAVGDEGAKSESVDGTPSYMAPEQALGEEVGPPSDLYSLGCVGHWLLSGHAPYRGEAPDALMDAHVNDPVPELPQAIRVRTPPALVNVLTRCMAKEPSHRPVSSALLAQVFARIAAECVDTFTPAMRSAFWREQSHPIALSARSAITVPQLSIREREGQRKAS